MIFEQTPKILSCVSF